MKPTEEEENNDISFQDGLDVSFRGSRGASFAQILNKIICAPLGLAVAYISLAVSEANNNLLDPACNTPNGGGIRPKSIPQELIDWYKRSQTHAVSALYLLSQVLQFQLELKETVTTGRKNPINEHVPQTVRELLSKMIDSYPEFSVCGSTVAAFVTQSCMQGGTVFYYENSKSVQSCHQCKGRLL
ncbi:adenosine deaminase domain-containing protein 1 [Oncorhynchus kisutch]|uniref:adenosine deaminase domain-containing protein 1 n=1 Tax=Oncorhynchus kisutch TaxID=8019 RepID=UPI0012DEECB4|nr:adenosine deaminase domain-containing protein 1-like [Oncorhynchus kisutch]